MLIPGTIIGDRYEIQEQVGAGGMADVYRAKDHVLERDVAIKVLKPEFAEDKTFVSKFRQEAQAAAGLEHPNIVNIYDVGFENNLYYIVMEYVQGITLKTYISKRGRLNYKEVLSIAIQVARGIEAAHNKGIIHRDIKPQNIIISNEGKVKVTDFGIAKATSSKTMSTGAMGSVHYISPEQARNGYVTKQSDIYSLGIVMYEMVTGRVPYDGETAVSIAIQHLQGQMKKPSELVDDVPVSLEHIIEKATQKSPERRYPTMGDLLVDLKKALINPDEDFVQDIDPDEEGKTKVLTPEEMEKIRQDSKEENFVPEKNPDDEDEDDDDEKVNPKMEKAITIMGIAAAVIIAVIVLVLVASFMGWFHFGSSSKKSTTTKTTTESTEKVTVPDLTGMTVDEVRTKLDSTGLKYEVVGKESSDQYKEGQVVRQTPKADKKVSKNTTIQLTLSSGPAETTVTVPNVVGKSRSAAESALKAVNLEVDVQYQTSDSVAQGVVISQSPKSGADGVKEGDTVTIVVSQGQETVSVPNVVGSSQSAAVSSLQNNGLTVGNISQAYSDTVAAGMVISQSVSGTQVKGTKVNLVVSLGKKPEEQPETVSVPNVVGLSQSDAASKLQSSGLTVGNITQDYSDSVAAGQVISQSVSGSQVKGTKVNLVISLGPKAQE
ncbi:MAG: Stk1 family PASTA domain-containing Ser/Thr kinase [Lachnospiraceae bacterium]|nr:Stk1 family PASTA domain-containing Ser/Thr kinase [Lachnospiraceae bacterium]